ncbi:hypothetical protein TELCIR_21231, partial [Teladorsagia circumcincta]
MLYRRGIIKLDAALIHVSAPDAKGFCTLGTSVGTARAGVANADHIIGFGAVPDAACAAMKNHKDLGLHTEMFSDGVLQLIASNALTNKNK